VACCDLGSSVPTFVVDMSGDEATTLLARFIASYIVADIVPALEVAQVTNSRYRRMQDGCVSPAISWMSVVKSRYASLKSSR
jgi:hypothetical protein